MCTAISFKTKDHYFGRNLDLEYSYCESVTITPRNFPLYFRKNCTISKHYAIIGIATIADDYPLYYDATNEHGLSMAGLNFPGNAVYNTEKADAENITPYELIPWILGQCKTVSDAEKLLTSINLINEDFSTEYRLTPLHWIISDIHRSITVEPLQHRIQISDNPVGVLTNNPVFEYHMLNLANYINLTADEPHNRFADKLALQPYSRGMGAIGLPGDLSSSSRFIRAAFTKLNSVCKDDECESVSQFFHILGSVAQTSGCNRTKYGNEKTIYSSCCNTNKGIYYYTTYQNSQVNAVHLKKADLEAQLLYSYPLVTTMQIHDII